jgi:phosphatidyl-myo-inositol dimannoside synthase
VLTPYVHPGFGGDRPQRAALYKTADAVLALLETDRQHLISLGVSADKIHLSGVVPLLPAASDPEAFRSDHGLAAAPVVLFVGRIAPHKGYLELLQATDIVWRTRPEVRFIFIGPGEANATGVFEQKNDSRILYLGAVSEQVKGNALAACDILCMPSIAEILPAVYLEAWSYGKPVIGGTAKGLDELIEGNGAGVIAEKEPGVIAQKILMLLGDDALRHEMGEKGRAMVAKRFSEPALVDAFEATYRAVSSTRTSATR